MRQTTKKLYDGTFFLYCYLTLTLLSFNPFVYYLPVIRVLVALTALLGVAAFCYRLIHYKKYKDTPCLWGACAFLLSALVTLLLNVRYGLMESAQGFLWLLFQLLILFPRDAFEKKETTLKQFYGIGGYFVAYNALMAFLGLLMVLFGYGEVHALSPTEVVPRGFVWGRLWGMYSDPNYGSAFVCVSFALSLYFFMRVRTRRMRVLLAFCMLFLYLYVVFSDSRTGMVTLAALLTAYAFFRFFARVGERGKNALRPFRRAAVSLLLAICVAGCAAGGVQVVKLAYNSFVNLVYPPEEGAPGEQPGDDKHIERGYDDQSDMSNGRLALWKSGAELFSKAPVFGVGFRNFQAAARELVPSTYLINNPQNFQFDAYHNVVVDVLAAQGAVGIFAFLAFALCALVRVFRLFWRAARHDTRTALLVGALCAVLAAILAESLFISDLFYVNTPTSFLFWFVLGLLMRLTKDLGKRSDFAVGARLEEWETVLAQPLCTPRGREAK